MDVLGNILKNMTKPPVLAEDVEKKKRLEEAKRSRLEEQRKVHSFKEEMKKMISKFAENDGEQRLQLEPMSKPQRALVYDLIENLPYDLLPHSFGREELDRHLVIFKPGYVPCEAEMQAMKRGEDYIPAPISAESADEQPSTTTAKTDSKKNKPPEYLQKYAKYLGNMEDAKEAAQSTETRRVYGCVSSELKKDKRTIEETLADIQARKKVKQLESTTESS